MKFVLPPTVMSAVSLLFADFMALKSRLENPFAPHDGVLPEPPDIFNPILRFAVCSDIHNRNDRFCAMMDACYAYADAAAGYRKLDAVLIGGDFTNSGFYDEMVQFKAALDASLRRETVPILCIGNHEYFACKRRNETEYGTTEQKFRAVFGAEPDAVYQINGFTFLAASYDESGKHFFGREKRGFYRQALKTARLHSREKPIFVLQHPHPALTVYGSWYWADFTTGRLWRKTPNVVNFSGHSHYPMNDPRSIWQGSYTALGTGSLKYFEIEKELRCGFYGSVPDAAAQFYIVEADAKGSLMIRCYDLNTASFFGAPYYIDKPADKGSYRYTYQNQRRADASPAFPPSPVFSLTQDCRGNHLLTFSVAADRFAVHDYKIKVQDIFGRTVYSDSHLSEYYLLSRDSRYITVNLGRRLQKGREYTISVWACNCYYRLSKPMKKRFLVAE